MTSGQNAPADWYPDPLGRHEHRYWDGNEWTQHVASRGLPATDPLTGSGATQDSDVLDAFDFDAPLFSVACTINGRPREVTLWWDRVEWQNGQPLDVSSAVRVGTDAATRSHLVKSSARSAVESVLPVPGAGLAASLIAAGVTRGVAAGVNAGLPSLARGIQKAAGSGSDRKVMLSEIEGVTNQPYDRRIRTIELRSAASAGKKPTSFMLSADEAATFHNALLEALDALPRREAALKAMQENPREENRDNTVEQLPSVPSQEIDQARRGVAWVLTGPVLHVEQKAKLKERHAEYGIYDENGRLVGRARQTGQRNLKVVDANGNETLSIIERSGAFRVKSEFVVRDARRKEIGRIVQSNLGFLRDFRFSLESRDQTLGSLNNERRGTRRFNILDATGAEVARVTNTPKGDTTDRYTTADNYTLQLAHQLADPLYSLVLASVFVVDIEFHQNEPDDLPTSRSDRRQVRRDIRRQDR